MHSKEVISCSHPRTKVGHIESRAWMRKDSELGTTLLFGALDGSNE
jgi:hypothetical protein